MKICVLGGTGFVGRSLLMRLTEAGHQLWVPTRGRERHRDLTVLPSLVLVDGDVYRPTFLRDFFQGKDAVINLVGILNESRRLRFEHAHVQLPAHIVQACQEAGVGRLLHMSALNAAPDSPSAYLRTKAAGEENVHRAASTEFRVTSFRPSVIFGAHDSFTNRFAKLLRLAPGVFPLACPEAKFAPVYVDDVVRAFSSALSDYRTFGARYDLCGPKIYTLREIVAYLARLLRKRTRIVGLNDTLSRLQAGVLEHFPGRPFSRDNYRSLQVDSVCPNETAGALRNVFGIVPTSVEQVVPGYLGSA